VSRTKQALAWMAENKTTVYAAAKHFGLAPTTLYVYIKKHGLAVPKHCPMCGKEK